MIADETARILDNPVWYALTSTHAHLASGTELVKRFPSEVEPFAGLVEPVDDAYRDLAQLVSPGEWIALWGDTHAELPGWTTQIYAVADQMVCQQPIDAVETDIPVVDLTAADVPDMLELVHLTEPGPLFPRTIELGRYIGIRQAGKLVAMAGERMRPRGYCEVSAVCTHPDHRGRGYARLLVSRVAAWNWQRGDTPFLHVDPRNAGAIRLYASLHFRKRRGMPILVISR